MFFSGHLPETNDFEIERGPAGHDCQAAPTRHATVSQPPVERHKVMEQRNWMELA